MLIKNDDNIKVRDRSLFLNPLSSTDKLLRACIDSLTEKSE